MIEFLRRNKAILSIAFFIILALFFWLLPAVFFYWDDWSIIDSYLHTGRLSYILTSYNNHVQPIFKSVYFSEIFLFGKNSAFYQITSLVLFGMAAYFFQLVYTEVSPKNAVLPFIIPIIMIGHPDWGEVTLWIFQICIILQIFFQAAAILFYFRYTKSQHQWHFYYFIAALILQNFCFGNGIFFPFVFIFAELLNRGFKLNIKGAILIVIQIAFILIQKLLSQQSPSVSDIFSHISSIASAFYVFMTLSIARFFFIKLVGGSVLIYISLFLFATLCFFAYRNDKKKTLFGLCYLFISAISIPIARAGHIHYSYTPYYYTVLLFPAMFLILYIGVSHIDIKYLGYVVIFTFVIAGTYYILDIKVKNLYNYIHFKNKERMTDAILYSKEYFYPFDESATVTCLTNLYLDNIKDTAIQKSIQKNSTFEMDSTLINYLKLKAATISSHDDIVATFKKNSRSNINCYKELTGKSLFDLDIAYQKQ